MTQNTSGGAAGLARDIAPEVMTGLAIQAVEFFIQRRELAAATPEEIDAIRAEHERLMRQHYDASRAAWDAAG